MPLSISLAFKNIFRDRRRSFTLGINYFFISLILLFLFALTAGIKKNITSTVIASTAGDITIAGEYIIKGRTYQGIKNFPHVSELIKKTFPDATLITRYTLSSAVYYKNVSKRLSFVGIHVADDKRLQSQIKLHSGSWKDFETQPNAIIMPKSIAHYFGLSHLDDVLISTRSRFGAFNTGTVQVRGLATTANYFLRELILCHFDFLRSLDLADSITASKMFVYFKNPRDIDQKRSQLLEILSKSGYNAEKPASKEDALNAVSAASPRYKVQDENLNQTRLTVATSDEVTGVVSQVVLAINNIGLFIAGIMLFIISVSIFINMRMTITERMQEIGTLRALGATQGEIIRLFILENVFLSLLFICTGIICGLGIIGIFSYLISFPADGVLGLALNNGHLVLQPTIPALIFISSVLTLFTALFSFFPARYSGKIPAAVALTKTNG